jgi:hypothetical protein
MAGLTSGTSAGATSESSGTEHHEGDSGGQGHGLLDIFGQLKSLAIGTTLGVFGQAILNAVPQDMRSGLADLVKDLTEYLGGKPQQNVR